MRHEAEAEWFGLKAHVASRPHPWLVLQHNKTNSDSETYESVGREKSITADQRLICCRLIAIYTRLGIYYLPLLCCVLCYIMCLIVVSVCTIVNLRHWVSLAPLFCSVYITVQKLRMLCHVQCSYDDLWQICIIKHSCCNTNKTIIIIIIVVVIIYD